MTILDNAMEPALTYARVPWIALTPHEENPNNGDVEAIAESIRTHGVYKPVIVTLDGVILAGHHVYYAAGELGQQQLDVVVRPYTSNDPRARKVLAGDNRIAQLGRTDDGLLLTLLRQIEQDEGGLVGTGYVSEDIQALNAVIEATGQMPLAPEGFPEYDETLATEHRCPSCGYEWSGPASGISGRGKEKYA